MGVRLLGAPLLALLLAGCSADSTAHPPAAAASTSTAAAIPGAPACEQLPATSAVPEGDTLPQITLSCLGHPGSDVALDHLTGRPTLVNLWATWCGPCREEMPLLQDAFARYGQQIRFLGVDTQDDPAAAASFAADLHVRYPQVVDPDGRLLDALGARGLPVALAVDANGRIVDRVVGQLSTDGLATLIDRLS